MDTTKWMEGFANYRWKGLYGKEAAWIGKPMFGINRMPFRASLGFGVYHREASDQMGSAYPDGSFC